MSGRIEEALANCLERLEAGELSAEEALRLYPELRSELEPMLELAAELRSMPRIEAPASLRGYKRPVFRPAPVREAWWRRLLPASGLSFGWASPLAQAAAILAVLFVAGGGTLVASANSLPDEPLYPVKLAVENAQLALAQSDNARAELEFQFASNRLAEVESAAKQGRAEAVAKGAELYREKIDAATKGAGATVQADPQAEETLRQNVEALNKALEQVKNPRAQAAISTAIARTEAVEEDNGPKGGKPNEKSGKPEDKQAAPAPVAATAAPTVTPLATPTPVTAAPVATPDTHEPPGQVKRQTEQPGNSGHSDQQGQEQRGQGQGQPPQQTPAVQDGSGATPTPTHTATADPPGQQNRDVSRGNGQQKKAEPETTDTQGNGQKKGNDKPKVNENNIFGAIIEGIQKLVGAKK